MKNVILGLCLFVGLCVVSGCQTAEAGPKELVESYINEYYTLEYDENLTEKEFLDKHLYMMSQNEESIASYEAYVKELETFMTLECIKNSVPRRDLSHPTDFVLKNKSDLAVKSIEFETVLEEDDFADYRVTVNLTLTSSETSDVYDAVLEPRVTLKKVDDTWKIDTFITSDVNSQIIE